MVDVRGDVLRPPHGTTVRILYWFSENKNMECNVENNLFSIMPFTYTQNQKKLGIFYH